MNRAQLLPGLLFIVLGSLFLLDAVDVVAAGPAIAGWWPLAIIALGLARLADRPPDRVGGAITAAIGVVLLGVTQGLVQASVFTILWPLALIGVGAWLLTARQRLTGGTESDDAVSAVVVFSGRKLIPRSARFTGGSLLAVFGGVELDLRACRPDPDGCHLDATVVFGGCDVTVPQGWRVRMRGPAIFGDYEDHTAGQHLPADAPTVDLRVLALFGGVEVKSAPEPLPPEPATGGMAAQERT